MFKDPSKNWDQMPLEADHSTARKGGRIRTDADRLLHGRCNRSRGDGSRDDQRPALTGESVVASSRDAGLGHRSMRWPW